MTNHITDTIARWEIEVSDLDARQPSEWEDLDRYLNESQYSYIRLGLLLEKIRNKCYWKYAAGKFGSFKEFCQRRMDLTIWQANSYIESAKVAIYLANAGYVQIPRNFSQAASLIPAYNDEVGYYQDRPVLERVWEQACQLPKITANAIKSLINPDWEPPSRLGKIDKILYDRAAKQAKKKGMSVDEYLEDLIGADEYEEAFETIDVVVTEPDPELGAIVDRLERKWQGVKIVDLSVDTFDNLMHNLIGNFIPKVQLE